VEPTDYQQQARREKPGVEEPGSAATRLPERALAEFVRTTLIGGVFFLVPMVLIILVVRHALGILRTVAQPLAELLPFKTVAGVGVATLVSALALLLICFAAGLVARTEPGRRLNQWLEWNLLRLVPGYTILKGVVESATGLESESKHAVALARIEDAWQLAFIIEEHEGGLLTVFVPGAPTPWAGSLYYLTEDRVKRLTVPAISALAAIKRLGAGSKEMLKGQM